MHRCFTDHFIIGTNKHVAITGDEAKHISRVLRLTPGAEVEVCDGSGITYIGVISAITKTEVQVEIREGKKDLSEPETKVLLFAGLSKGAKMELVIQKSVELGVSEIIPVETEFAVAKEGKTERWQRIAFEAAKQCKRPKVPYIHEALRFEDAVEMLTHCDLALCAYEKEQKVSAATILQRLDSGCQTCGVFVGPEGGFSDKEIACLTKKEIPTVSLGKRILRTETAAIVFVTLVMHQLGELG